MDTKSDVLSDILSGICPDIHLAYTLTFYLTFLAFYLASILGSGMGTDGPQPRAPDLRGQRPLRSGARSSGPAVPLRSAARGWGPTVASEIWLDLAPPSEWTASPWRCYVPSLSFTHPLQGGAPNDNSLGRHNSSTYRSRQVELYSTNLRLGVPPWQYFWWALWTPQIELGSEQMDLSVVGHDFLC